MITFELIALDGVKFRGEAHEIVLPTPDGQIAVFTHHAPLVSLADVGRIGIRVKPNDPDDFMEYFAVGGGVIEVGEGNTVRVLVDEADSSDELDEAREKEALEEAKRMLAAARDRVTLDKAQSLIDRQAVRLQVAGLRRRSSRRSGRIDNQTSR